MKTLSNTLNISESESLKALSNLIHKQYSEQNNVVTQKRLAFSLAYTESISTFSLTDASTLSAVINEVPGVDVDLVDTTSIVSYMGSVTSVIDAVDTESTSFVDAITESAKIAVAANNILEEYGDTGLSNILANDFDNLLNTQIDLVTIM